VLKDDTAIAPPLPLVDAEEYARIEYGAFPVKYRILQQMNQSLLRPSTPVRSLAGTEKCFGTPALGRLAADWPGHVGVCEVGANNTNVDIKTRSHWLMGYGLPRAMLKLLARRGDPFAQFARCPNSL
jgi:hypothetical protein